MSLWFGKFKGDTTDCEIIWKFGFGEAALLFADFLDFVWIYDINLPFAVGF